MTYCNKNSPGRTMYLGVRFARRCWNHLNNWRANIDDSYVVSVLPSPNDLQPISLRIVMYSIFALKYSAECAHVSVGLDGYLCYSSPYDDGFVDGSGRADLGGFSRKGGRKKCQLRCLVLTNQCPKCEGKIGSHTCRC